MPYKIHIGKTIKQLLIIQGVSVVDFSEKIHCTPRNVYKIFSRPSIDTALLVKINIALGQNLFLLYLTDIEIHELKVSLSKTAGAVSAPNDLAISSLYLKALKKHLGGK